MKLLSLYLLVGTVLAVAFQNANWPVITIIKSGDHKLLTQFVAGNATITQPQNYNSSLQNYTGANVPNVILGLRDLKIDPTTNGINFKVSVGSITKTGFVSTLVMSDNNNYSLIYYMYLAVDTAFPHVYLIGPQSTSATANSTFSITFNNSLIPSANIGSALVLAYISSFSITAGSLYIQLDGVLIGSSQASISLKTNNTINRIEISVIVVDRISLSTTQTYFLDSGESFSLNNDTSYNSSLSLFTLNYFNFFTGLTLMMFSANNVPFFEAGPAGRMVTSNADQLRYSSLQIRMRQCPNASLPYYTNEDRKCYGTCLASYGQDQTNKFCLPCPYSCLTCLADSTSCTSCLSTNFRTLNNAAKTCPCDAGYGDDKFAMCSSCHYTCQTCTNSSSTSCVTCKSTRTLNGSTCPCSTGSFDTNSGNSTCSACDYSCLTCSGIATNCTSCNSSTQRLFDPANLKCPCKTLYQDNGTAECIESPVNCTLPCVTCLFLGSNCTSCNSAARRILSSNTCPCKSGYSPSSSIADCFEICGDGLLLENTTQCDDGNTNSGDGCSSTCKLQSNFTCTTNRSAPTVCTANTGYTTNLLSLVKQPSDNTMTAQIQIVPAPPAGTAPYLINLADQLQITSYSLSGTTMTLNLLIKKELSSDQTLLAGFSIINTKTSFPMQSDNKLSLKPYSSTYLALYKAEVALVWIYIAAVWIGGLWLMIRVDIHLFAGVVELWIYSGLAWIAVEGQPKWGLLFEPLRNLRYVFGYNMQIGDTNCVLQILNVGFILNIIPLLLFLGSVILSKRCSQLFSPKVKRFLLFDLTYAVAVANGFLVVFGLALPATSFSSSPIQIASIAVGVAYLAGVAVASYRLFFIAESGDEINPKMEVTKKNLFRPKVLPIYWLSVFMLSLAYVAIREKTTIGSLIMMGSFLLLFILFGFVNLFINKIRYMLNLISLIFVYGCVLLINNVSSADWAGILLLSIMFLQVGINILFLYFERTTISDSLSELSDTARAKMQVNIQGEAQQEEGGSQRENQPNKKEESELQEFDNQFTIYQPTIKKKPELDIVIPAPEIYTSNAIETAMKTYNLDVDKERMTDLKVNLNQSLLATSPRYKRRERLEEDLEDIANKQVRMEQI